MFSSVILGVAGCSSGEAKRSIQIKEGLGLFESLIPVPAESVMSLYTRFDPATFHSSYGKELHYVQRFVDSMNASLDPSSRIDTIAIDHSIENFGNAARSKKTIFVSSSYFFLFNNPAILRSVLTHEFGHIYWEKLGPAQRDSLDALWRMLRENALFYLFRDGEYSGNAQFGGHPDESPGELFASAFNIFRNKPDEFRARIQFVEPRHYPLFERVRRIVMQPSD